MSPTDNHNDFPGDTCKPCLVDLDTSYVLGEIVSQVVKDHEDLLSTLNKALAEAAEKRRTVKEIWKDQRKLKDFSEKTMENRAITVAVLRKSGGLALKYAAPYWIADENIVLEAVQENGEALQHALPKLIIDSEIFEANTNPKERARAFTFYPPLNNNKNIVLAAVRRNGSTLQYASNRLREDREAVLVALRQNGLALKHAAPELRADLAVVEVAVRQNGLALEHALGNLKNNEQIVLKALAQDALALQYADTRFKASAPHVLKAVNKNGLALIYAAHPVEYDPTVVKAAVCQNGLALEHAAYNLQANQEIVEAAVRQNGLALEHAAYNLQANLEIVEAAVRQNGLALEHAAYNLQANLEIVKAAVRENGLALRYTPFNLYSNEDVVLEAVTQNGAALEYAVPSLRKNRQVVLAAVNNNGAALQHADATLQDDTEVVLKAVKKDVRALEYASSRLRANPDVFLEAASQNALTAIEHFKPHSLSHRDLDEYWKRVEDIKIILAAVKKNVWIFQLASDQLKAHPAILLVAVKKNPRLLTLVQSKEAVLALLELITLTPYHRNVEILPNLAENLKSDPEVVYAVWKKNQSERLSLVDPNTLVRILRTEAKDNPDFALDAVVATHDCREVVFAAVQVNGLAFQDASDELKADEEVGLAAVKQNLAAIKYLKNPKANGKIMRYFLDQIGGMLRTTKGLSELEIMLGIQPGQLNERMQDTSELLKVLEDTLKDKSMHTWLQSLPIERACDKIGSSAQGKCALGFNLTSYALCVASILECCILRTGAIDTTPVLDFLVTPQGKLVTALQCLASEGGCTRIMTTGRNNNFNPIVVSLIYFAVSLTCAATTTAVPPAVATALGQAALVALVVRIITSGADPALASLAACVPNKMYYGVSEKEIKNLKTLVIALQETLRTILKEAQAAKAPEAPVMTREKGKGLGLL